MIVPENSRETVSVSTICDEYCSSASASCSKSTFKQHFTNIKNSYSADLITKNQKTVGKAEVLKFTCGTGIFRMKRRWMKKLAVYLN